MDIVSVYFKVLSLALEPTSKSAVHELAKVVSSKVDLASKPMYGGVWLLMGRAICKKAPRIYGLLQV